MNVFSGPVAGQHSAARVGLVPAGVPTGAAAGIVAAFRFTTGQLAKTGTLQG